jgi:transposase
MRAAEMFGRGKRQVDVVTELGVSAQTASRWHRAWQEQGQAGLAGAGRAGRRCRLADEQLAAVEAALVAGPAANGFPTEMWTLARVADDRGADRGAVFADPDLGDSAAAAGLDPPAPGAPGGGA